MFNQQWPINKQYRKMRPYISSSFSENKTGYGGVLERYWLSSKGVAIFVDNEVPLHVATNYPRLCLKGSFNNSKYKDVTGRGAFLKYHMCVGPNAKVLHQFMSDRNWKKPKGIPDELMFTLPIWSTRTALPQGADHKFSEFVRGIKQNDFEASRLRIG